MSTLRNSIDVKSLVKLEKYAGEEEQFQTFKWQLCIAVRVMNPDIAARLEWVEKHLQADFTMSRLDPPDKILSNEAYSLLALLCTDQALDFVQSAEENNGFEAWKHLCRARLLRSSVALLNQILEPKCPSMDAKMNIKNWQQKV